MKLNTAPVFMHFPSKTKPKKEDTLEIQRYGFDAEVLAKLINDRTGEFAAAAAAAMVVKQ